MSSDIAAIPLRVNKTTHLTLKLPLRVSHCDKKPLARYVKTVLWENYCKKSYEIEEMRLEEQRRLIYQINVLLAKLRSENIPHLSLICRKKETLRLRVHFLLFFATKLLIL